MYRMYAEETPLTMKAIKSSPVIQDGCTILNGMGYWKGVPEKSVIVEVTDPQEDQIRRLARRIVRACGQEAVLLVHLANNTEFVTV